MECIRHLLHSSNYVDLNETSGEKARWKLFKCMLFRTNFCSNTRENCNSLTYFYFGNHPRWARYTGHCWKSKDELISNIFLWTTTHRHTHVSWLTKTYIHLFCVNPAYHRENLISVTADWDGWREKERVRERECQGNPCCLHALTMTRIGFKNDFNI